MPVVSCVAFKSVKEAPEPLNEPPSVKFPDVVTVPVSVKPLTVPVPPTLVTVPVLVVLLLNVFQSVDVKYPSTLVVAATIDITGVVVPVATDTGAVPDTLVTPFDVQTVS